MRLKTVKSQKDEANSYYNEKYSKQIDCWDVEFDNGTAGKTRSFKISEVGFEGELEKNDKGFWIQKRDEQSSFKGTSSGASKYDGDGQKQGMAIKAGADYVTRHSDKKLPPEVFAKAVEAYATALYNLELKKSKPSPASWEEMRDKKNEILARAEAEKEKTEYPTVEEHKAAAKEINDDYGIVVDEIDTTPINLDDIPF